MNCYRCGGMLQKRLAKLPGEYAGEEFEVCTRAMVCVKCGYTTLHASQIDEFRTKLADLYRQKHGILTSKQIREIRTRLGMTQEQFAEYLNVGVASVKRWELGKPQDKSSDELLRIRCSLPRAEQNFAEVLLRQGGEPNEFSGGRRFSFNKLANTILFFLERAEEVRRPMGPLHINKLCWYADAENYRRHRVTITGVRYARLPWGPAIDDYRLIFRELQRRGFIRAQGVDRLLPLRQFSEEEFSLEEKKTLRHVWKRFENRLPQIVAVSHDEKAWKTTGHAELISFALAR